MVHLVSPAGALAPTGEPPRPGPASRSGGDLPSPGADEAVFSAEARRLADESAAPAELPPDEQREVEELRATDREVRAHERAHAAAAGSLALGPPSYEYRAGPDGRRYAVGGEVQLDTSPVPDDPEATIDKAERIIRAALAPTDPSSQDRRVAAKAAAMAARARQELAREAVDTGEYGGSSVAPGTLIRRTA